MVELVKNSLMRRIFNRYIAEEHRCCAPHAGSGNPEWVAICSDHNVIGSEIYTCPECQQKWMLAVDPEMGFRADVKAPFVSVSPRRSKARRPPR